MKAPQSTISEQDDTNAHFGTCGNDHGVCKVAGLPDIQYDLKCTNELVWILDR